MQGSTNLRRVFIDDSEGNGDELWRRVEESLGRGQSVWLRSPLLKCLTDEMGQKSGKIHWLVLNPHRAGEKDFLTRLKDVILSSIVLIGCLPFFALIAILVKCSSPGPVFYVAIVVGKDHTRFLWYKFRLMSVTQSTKDIERRSQSFRDFVEGSKYSPATESPVKVIEEARVTPIGRVLRKYSLDELPQLWNVLKGDMSLVGPRPCLPYEEPFYKSWQDRRFLVRPGLSGVWQVYGRGLVGFDEGAAMDVYYVCQRGFWFDLLLILKTLKVVAKGKGAL